MPSHHHALTPFLTEPVPLTPLCTNQPLPPSAPNQPPLLSAAQIPFALPCTELAIITPHCQPSCSCTSLASAPKSHAFCAKSTPPHHRQSCLSLHRTHAPPLRLTAGNDGPYTPEPSSALHAPTCLAPEPCSCT
ncbi:hypothetical protein SLEP1_g53571 [Rubroshorea leprosula]|uniref:Uncharacterized protein n=1 Tax=Rubroshorea leprosula TaxID=152421 RepID=A0AAV5M9S8_9ROSI|nr:hypothetical protein SLEP1_g53571 [Rubroshorea leprosula]